MNLLQERDVMVIKSELILRVITGVILVAVFSAAVREGGMVFDALVFLCAIIMSLEFDKMRGDSLKTILIIGAPLFFAKTPDIAIMIMMLGGASLFVLGRVVNFSVHWAQLAVFLVFFPCLSAIWIRGQGDAGLAILIWLVAVTVATDVGAYFVGKKFGRTKLAESISPKKTREGAYGGILAAVAASLLFDQSLQIVAITVVISCLAIAGDLAESAIKRFFEVKDSGKILPGHGGLLDRMDSFLLTLPAVALMYNYGWINW